MHSTTLLTFLLTFLLTSIAVPISTSPIPAPAPVPVSARQDTYHGVSINAIISPGLSPQKISSPIPVQINTLTPCYGDDGNGCSVSALILDPGVAINIDIEAVECRAYKDFAGIVPGSAPFNVSVEADISTNLATVEAVLCYVVEV